ncbi:hypothetical protein JMJ77_0009103 [Colletotrichum scovillei]|uniref:Uncharacterized protein n=1 Tax=Colletotrichum scovillei TaxID=1209932 RepID=A0A9P7QYN0_9PEZI|nr:hypothetical protein JMJ77_0009103 [Colletotrichum scovillei]KAG7052178.1 hypothetical protein JMJ78_0005200 [Colletotrichum scovillei]KAG7064467.1 hypothetical protein JMJ76_0012232 [Colletotrichum scovillei]
MSHQNCSLSLGAIYLRPSHSRKERLPAEQPHLILSTEALVLRGHKEK